MQIIQEKSTAPRGRFNRDENVLAAAIEVMSERGYSATTIQEVADRVGVLKGSLYHYFSSKEELLYRILEESYRQNAQIVEQVTALGLPAFEELMEYLRRVSFWYLSNVERANIFFSEGRHLTGDRLERARQSGREYEAYFQGLVTRAQEDGVVRSDLDAKLINRFLLGTINSIRSWPSRSGQNFSDESIVESFLALVKPAILASTS